MHRLTITAVGKDRPGIVAAVTKVLFERGCNLADCSMSLLSGQFAMILLIHAPDELKQDALRGALRPPAERLELSILVTEIGQVGPERLGHAFVVSIYGVDHPGIVHAVSEQLAALGVNITNLMSQVVGEGIYTMVLEVFLPDGLDPAEVRAGLVDLARDLKVDFNLRAADITEL